MRSLLLCLAALFAMNACTPAPVATQGTKKTAKHDDSSSKKKKESVDESADDDDDDDTAPAAGDDDSTVAPLASKLACSGAGIAAYADANEANAVIGTAIALGGLEAEVTEVLTRIQNDLFDVGADLATPVVAEPKFPPLRVEQFYIDRLEADCDRFNESLDKLRSFILPGGTPGSALLHVSRTVVRRAERSAWTALDVHGESMNVLTAKYLNRLSDLLFILARDANREAGGDVLWVPGASRGN